MVKIQAMFIRDQRTATLTTPRMCRKKGQVDLLTMSVFAATFFQGLLTVCLHAVRQDQ